MKDLIIFPIPNLTYKIFFCFDKYLIYFKIPLEKFTDLKFCDVIILLISISLYLFVSLIEIEVKFFDNNNKNQKNIKTWQASASL